MKPRNLCLFGFLFRFGHSSIFGKANIVFDFKVFFTFKLISELEIFWFAKKSLISCKATYTPGIWCTFKNAQNVHSVTYIPPWCSRWTSCFFFYCLQAYFHHLQLEEAWCEMTSVILHAHQARVRWTQDSEAMLSIWCWHKTVLRVCVATGEG